MAVYFCRAQKGGKFFINNFQMSLQQFGTLPFFSEADFCCVFQVFRETVADTASAFSTTLSSVY